MNIVRYIVIGFISLITGILTSFIVLFSLSPILEFIGFKNNGDKWNYDPIALLSINVGILQTLLAIITLGIGSVAFFNFLSMKKEFKRFKKSIKKQVKNIRNNGDAKETSNKELEKITKETDKLEENQKGEEVKDVF
ncbi:hypothetical protein [uncultured Brachyspira sp.]|uniref:hypothetical protein n=1 Tax=uncultured Brachyspira sp. TaxID=221953 RepID=UPI0025E6A737|nr:hypothetical protein [uncultured Brachyspira sp.]